MPEPNWDVRSHVARIGTPVHLPATFRGTREVVRLSACARLTKRDTCLTNEGRNEGSALSSEFSAAIFAQNGGHCLHFPATLKGVMAIECRYLHALPKFQP